MFPMTFIVIVYCSMVSVAPNLFFVSGEAVQCLRSVMSKHWRLYFCSHLHTYFSYSQVISCCVLPCRSLTKINNSCAFNIRTSHTNKVLMLKVNLVSSKFYQNENHSNLTALPWITISINPNGIFYCPFDELKYFDPCKIFDNCGNGKQFHVRGFQPILWFKV